MSKVTNTTTFGMEIQNEVMSNFEMVSTKITWPAMVFGKKYLKQYFNLWTGKPIPKGTTKGPNKLSVQ